VPGRAAGGGRPCPDFSSSIACVIPPASAALSIGTTTSRAEGLEAIASKAFTYFSATK
jgi:hypothetical protein